ncbi:MAG: Phenylalanine-tRNA ligase beta subunit [Parcubacteria group bacterium GW2011_GWF1_40_6]|nr:MAG: Phenylalanine-tRNA ligase beta subunit [Parcubacteria group bacterium GW2011_GWF1_40_6]
MKVSYSWLQNYFEEKLPESEKISEGIIFHSFEIEETEKMGNDVVFDIKVLPDRAHDCLSHWGIAKEISAIFDLKIKDKKYKIFEPKPTELEIKIEDEKCLRYMGRMVKNVEVSESPAWLKEKLNAIGQKSINNIVDAANFMMFDLGQPIHCFDLDKLESAKIIVRNAIAGEEINLLGIEKIGNLQKSRSVLLSQNDLVIADEKGPLAIAGIKGGTKAEVDNNTKNIVIEVANFNSVTTRKTAKKLNILTDAVKRYENEISPELCTKVMDAITDLVFELGGGEVEDTIDKYPKKVEQKKVSVSINYINKRLGASFSKAEMESVWKKLNFTYIVKDGDFEIEIPYLRIDLTGPHDLVEEVIRILGYDRLEEKLPEIKLESKMNETYSKMFLARNKLLGEGYSEVMTYTFRDKGEVEVLASASDKKFLRTNLSDGLRESLKLNQLNAPLLGMKEIKIFEIGTIFKKGGEEMCVAYGDKKGIKEMKLNEYAESAKLFLNGLAGVGDPENRGPEKMTLPMKFKMWSLFPFIARDIAVWVPENILSEEVEKIIKENAGDVVVRGPELFDEFKKEGQISYAFRLVFQSFESTLTDQEINDVMTKVSDKLKERDWQVR